MKYVQITAVNMSVGNIHNSSQEPCHVESSFIIKTSMAYWKINTKWEMNFLLSSRWDSCERGVMANTRLQRHFWAHFMCLFGYLSQHMDVVMSTHARLFIKHDITQMPVQSVCVLFYMKDILTVKKWLVLLLIQLKKHKLTGLLKISSHLNLKILVITQ